LHGYGSDGQWATYNNNLHQQSHVHVNREPQCIAAP
jgi:hypothetical protein